LKILTKSQISALTPESKQFKYECINKIFDEELKQNFSAQKIFHKGLTFPRKDSSNAITHKRNYLLENPTNAIPDNSFGIYIIWQDTKLLIGKKVLMRAIYVGQGNVKDRLNTHHSEKRLYSQFGNYFISFYEIDRRLALYFEAAFLESYFFKLNTEHMYGEEELYAMFDEEVVDYGNQKFIEQVTKKNSKYQKLIDKDVSKVLPKSPHSL